jgi:hypothetical protein
MRKLVVESINNRCLSARRRVAIALLTVDDVFSILFGFRTKSLANELSTRNESERIVYPAKTNILSVLLRTLLDTAEGLFQTPGFGTNTSFGSQSSSIAKSQSSSKVPWKDVVWRRVDQVRDRFEVGRVGDSDVFRESANSEGRKIGRDVEEGQMLADLLRRVRVVSKVRVEQILWVGSSSDELSLKVNDLGSETFHARLDGFFFGGRRDTARSVVSILVVISRPWPRPALDSLLGHLDDIVDQIALFLGGVSVRVRRNVEQDTLDDGRVQIENRLLLVVLLGRKTSESLIKPETLDLRIFTSGVTFDVKVD